MSRKANPNPNPTLRPYPNSTHDPNPNPNQVSRKAQLDVSCLTARGELQRATKKRDYEQAPLTPNP